MPLWMPREKAQSQETVSAGTFVEHPMFSRTHTVEHEIHTGAKHGHGHSMTQGIRRAYMVPPTFSTASGDPNDTSSHRDVIRETLKARAADETVSDADRESARAMLAAFYPETSPADPKRWQGQGNVAGGAITNSKVKE